MRPQKREGDGANFPSDRSQRLAVWTVLSVLAVLAVPATLTLFQVKKAGHLDVDFAQATPFGYTWSLLIFIVPVAVLGAWFKRLPERKMQGRAFLYTLLAVVPTGFVLDFLLAKRLLKFDNPAATLGISVPVIGGHAPVEEFVFYLTGFMAVLLAYIWADESWLSEYNVPDYVPEAKSLPKIVVFHGTSVVTGAALVLVAIGYKSIVDGVFGIPLYFIYLVLTGIIPSAGLFPSVRSFINWRALSLVVLLITLVSLIWEVTLGVPYGWWGYQPRPMVGIFVDAWSGLPIEAVLVWLAVTYMTVIVYEAMKVWLASGMTAREAATGRTQGASSRSRPMAAR